MAKQYVIEETMYVRLPVTQKIVSKHVLTEEEIQRLKDEDAWAEPEDCARGEFLWEEFKDEDVIEGAELFNYDYDIVDVVVNYYSEEV